MSRGSLLGWPPHDLFVAFLAAETALIVAANRLWNRHARRRRRS
ncbi:hypothetical protein [Acidiferrimicrobium sp. IK]|nr:hypothetical protein [Acidiferrimicrobium sp. IK]